MHFGEELEGTYSVVKEMEVVRKLVREHCRGKSTVSRAKARQEPAPYTKKGLL